jgi:hypothetical protein
MTARLLGFICLAVLCVILTLGLQPFHSPVNDVAWLPDRPGLALGRNSSMMTSGALPVADDAGGSVEIWLLPSRIWDRSTFLGFCDPGNPKKLSFRQSQLDLAIKTATSRVFIARLFRKNTSMFLTIASGANGTAVYVDGGPFRTVSQPRLSARDFSGQLVVGDSPGQSDSWQGLVYGLAVYHRELKPEEVTQHYLAWTQKGQPEIAADERPAALFPMNEGKGEIVYNSAAPGPDLEIPARYTVAEKIFLEPFWQEFELTWSYWGSAIKNIIGFVPVGLCFYPWLAALRLKRAALAAVLCGTAISVTMEGLQGFLPTRGSGTTDIFTNTFGTWLGVAGYRAARPLLRRYGLPD